MPLFVHHHRHHHYQEIAPLKFIGLVGIREREREENRSNRCEKKNEDEHHCSLIIYYFNILFCCGY